MDIRIKCKCGKFLVPFNMRDNIFGDDVIENIYCPEESKDINFNADTMINDNGWIIEFDMELAKFVGSRKLDISPDIITPEFLFDEGYATWKEIFPGEIEISKKDRDRIIKLAKTDRERYFKEFKDWANRRMKNYKKEGWRKAQKIA